MVYSDFFSIQWDRLVSDFISSIKGYTPEMINIDRLNDWYRTNSFRWSSIAENEGILLEHENNDALKQELLKELSKFSFSEVPLSKKPKALPYIGTGALSATVIGTVFKLCFHFKFVFVAIEAIVLILASAVLYAKKLDDCNKKQGKQIEEGYSRQLVSYKEHLIRICKKFEENNEE